MSQTVWKIKDLELEFDLSDYFFMQKFENAFKRMEVGEKEAVKIGMTSEKIKATCELYYQLFEDIFGMEIKDRLFEKQYNARECEEVYESFYHFYSEQVKEDNKKRMERNAKYRPNKSKPNPVYHKNNKSR